MLWIKAFHVIFMVTWFGGLFYLPRLFVYHCEVGGEGSAEPGRQADDSAGYARFCLMERKLFAIMTLGMLFTIALGAWLWIAYWPLATGWLHAKAGLALALLGYHAWLYLTVKRFAAGRNRHGSRFYRIINEVPALLLIAMVILAIVKPF